MTQTFEPTYEQLRAENEKLKVIFSIVLEKLTAAYTMRGDPYYLSTGVTSAYHAAMAVQRDVDAYLGWQPIETAPKDGTLLELIVHGGEHPTEDEFCWRTIGHNNYDNDGEDKWVWIGWCWSHDHFVEGTGEPTHWRLMPAKHSDALLTDASDWHAMYERQKQMQGDT